MPSYGKYFPFYYKTTKCDFFGHVWLDLCLVNTWYAVQSQAVPKRLFSSGTKIRTEWHIHPVWQEVHQTLKPYHQQSPCYPQMTDTALTTLLCLNSKIKSSNNHFEIKGRMHLALLSNYVSPTAQMIECWQHCFGAARFQNIFLYISLVKRNVFLVLQLSTLRWMYFMSANIWNLAVSHRETTYTYGNRQIATALLEFRGSGEYTGKEIFTKGMHFSVIIRFFGHRYHLSGSPHLWLSRSFYLWHWFIHIEAGLYMSAGWLTAF